MNCTIVLVLMAASACSQTAPRGGPTEGYFAGADSTRLFYRTVGTGADTVVVIHGFQGNNQNYLAADLLSLARGRTLPFYDQRGGGLSSPVSDSTKLGVEAHVRDVEALRRYFGLERLIVLGHSGGAAIAIRYAAEHPGRVARLVMVAPPPPVTGPFTEETRRGLSSRLDSVTWERVNALQASLSTAPDPVRVCREIIGTLLPRAYFAGSANFRRMKGDFCASPPAKLRTQTQRTTAFRQSLPTDWRPGIGAIGVPVLIIQGAHDAIPMARSRAWAEALPNARLLVLPKADHLPWVEQPDRFTAAVTRSFEANGR